MEQQDDQQDMYSPVKCARRSLVSEDWVTPKTSKRPKEAVTATQLAVLAKVGISPDNKVAELRGYMELCREMAVLKEQGAEWVPLELEFLSSSDGCTKQNAMKVLAKVCEVAGVTDESAVTSMRGMVGEANRCVFLKAVAARALDMVAIKRLDSAGLVNEWAGALFAGGYKDKIPVPAQVNQYLKSQGEWVFGDFAAKRLTKTTRRLMQRQLHRVVFQHLQRTLSEEEIKKWVADRRKAQKFFKSKKDLAKAIDSLVEISKTPVVQAASEDDLDEGVSGQDSESEESELDGGVSGQDSGGSEDEEAGSGTGLRLTYAKSKEEVAEYILNRVEGFQDFASQWTLSQRELSDFTASAVDRKVADLKMPDQITAKVRVVISGLLPRVRKRKLQVSSFKAGASGLQQLLFGTEGKAKASANQIQQDVTKAAAWHGCRVFWLDMGNQRLGTVVSSEVVTENAHGMQLLAPEALFQVRSDAGENVTWSTGVTMKALHAAQDMQLSDQHKGIETQNAHSSLQGKTGAKEAIGALGEEWSEILDKVYEQMQQSKRFDALGWGKNGLLSGKSAMVIWAELRGKGFKKVIDHNAFQLVINAVFTQQQRRNVVLTGAQIVRSAFPTGGAEGLKSLTIFNPSEKRRGVTVEHCAKKQRIEVGGDGFTVVDCEEDNRIRKDWTNFGFTKFGLKRFFEVLTMIHGPELSNMWWNEVDELLEELLLECGANHAVDPMDELLTRVWRSLPLKFTDALLRAEREGVDPVVIMRQVKWAPDDWEQERTKVILSTALIKLEEARSDLRELVKGVRKPGTPNQPKGGGNGYGGNNGASAKANQTGGGRGGGGRGGRGGGGPGRGGNKRPRGQKKQDVDEPQSGAQDDPPREDRRSGLADGRDPRWERFDPKVKTWCEGKGFDSVYAARIAWVSENRGRCFWTCSELGAVLGGECNKGTSCRFADSHGT